MNPKLDREKTIALVKKALPSHKKDDVDLDDELGNLIPSEASRNQFRVTVQGLVQSHGFEIELQKIPIRREVKLGEIVHTLMSALPGHTPIEKPDQEPLEPPPPRTKPRKRIEERETKNEEEMS